MKISTFLDKGPLFEVAKTWKQHILKINLKLPAQSRGCYNITVYIVENMCRSLPCNRSSWIFDSWTQQACRTQTWCSAHNPCGKVTLSCGWWAGWYACPNHNKHTDTTLSSFFLIGFCWGPCVENILRRMLWSQWSCQNELNVLSPWHGWQFFSLFTYL